MAPRSAKPTTNTALLGPTRFCRRCGSVFEVHTQKTRTCTVCARYNSIQSNARHQRRDGHAPGLEMTRTQFAAWFATTRRHCVYCTITEDHLPLLGVVTQGGYDLARLGVDRVDSSRGYQIDNIRLCCFACNKVKSNTFSSVEMHELGRTVAAIWTARLAALGISWQPSF